MPESYAAPSSPQSVSHPATGPSPQSLDYSPAAWKSFVFYLGLGLVVSIGILLALAEFHEEIAEPFLTGLDHSLMQSLHMDASPALTGLMFTLTRIGSPIVLFPAVPLLAALLWWRKLRRDTILLLVAVIGGGALDGALKLHFKRTRPDVPWALAHEHSFSFPSGHSVLAVVLYGILLYLLMKYLPHLWQRFLAVTAAVFLIFGIGLSRIYLGVHYPSDVAAGYFVGCVWLLAVMLADWHHTREIARRQGPPKSEGSEPPRSTPLPA